MRNPLGPSIDASARVVFEALAATVAVGSRSDRRAVFPRYAGYYAWLSRLPRRLQRSCSRGRRSCSRGRRSLKLSTWRDGLLVMLLVLATPLAYAQFPPPPPLVPTPPVNVPPVANDDTGATPFNTPVDINVVANDTDADGNLDLASVAIVGNPTNGTAVPNGSGAVTYTPTTNFSGTDSFSYTVNDNQGATSNSATVAITVQPPPPPPAADLVLSLTDIPDPLTVNGQLTYTITVRNNGPGTATGVRVVDSLPPGAVLAGPAFSSQGECSGTVTVVCDLGTLAAGAHNEATVTINVIPTVTGLLSNAAHVTAVEPDPDPANNSRTETTTVEPEDPARADLAITAAVGPRASGQGFTYTLRVTNNGPATATGVQLTNDLPRGIALGAATASQANCSDTDPMLCDLGELASGATAEPVMIDVIRTEEETLPNRATVNGEQHDPVPENNFALTSALDLPTPQTTCNSKRCRLRLTCNLSDLLGRTCDNQVTLFVETRARRQSNQRAARAPRLVPFAAVIRNFPGGQTTNVPLKLTPKGREVASMLVQQGRKKLRGEMQIRNSAGGTDKIRLTVRLR